MPLFNELPPTVSEETEMTIPEPPKVLEVPNKWIPSPELRLWFYRVAGAVVPLLIALGFLTGEIAQLVLNIVAAVLAVGTPVLAGANTPRLTSGDVPDVSVKEAAENVDHAIVVGDVKPSE